MATEQIRRYKLQDILESILSSSQVYYNPPEGQKLTYPCIIYSLEGEDKEKADNIRYKVMNRYSITVIYKNADSTITNDILNSFNYVSFDRQYKSDNLYHDAITLFY